MHGFIRRCSWALFAFGFSAAAANAQERLYRNLDAVPGQSLRLGMAANVSKECKSGPLPEVKILTPPKQGSLAVRDGKTKAGALARCPTLEVPARGVFYQAKPKYSGSDEVVFEVKRPDGRVQVHTVRISVSEQAKPDAKAQDATDL